MSVLWIFRILFITILFSCVLFFGFLLKNREKYENLLNNRPFNIFLVVLYNATCFLAMGIYSDPSIVPPPAFLNYQFVICAFFILGFLSLGFGLFLMIKTLLIRKSVGAEDTVQGLIINDVYRYFRHPIYVGIVLVSLSIGLIYFCYDGLLIFPLILLINILQAKIEEKYDIGIRFKKEYEKYKQKTKIFGPIWLWVMIIIGISVTDIFIFIT